MRKQRSGSEYERVSERTNQHGIRGLYPRKRVRWKMDRTKKREGRVGQRRARNWERESKNKENSEKA